MPKNRINIKSQTLQKLLDFSLKAPFFTSYISLFTEANKVVSEILDRDTLIFAINPNEFDIYEIYYFDKHDFTISPKMFSKCSEGNINNTAHILSKRDEAFIFNSDRINKFIDENNIDKDKVLPHSAMFAPIVDRFDDNIGIAFLCGNSDYTQLDLEIFRQLAKVLATGINNIEKFELFSLYDEEYSEIINNSVLGIAKISNEFKLLKANDAFAKIFGFKDAIELFVPENQEFLLSMESTQRFKKGLISLKENKIKIENKEFLVQNRYGIKIWLSVTAHYHESFDKEWNFFEVLVSDITLLKNAEKELIINRKIYETILSVSFDGIVIIDQNQNIIDVNEVLAKRYGHRRSFYIGKPITIFGGNRNNVRENIEKLKDGLPHFNNTEHLSSDGKRYYYELSEQLIKLPKGEKIIVSMSRDITGNVKGKQYNAAILSNLEKVTNYLATFQEAIFLRMKEEKSLISRLAKQLSGYGNNNDKEILEELQKYFEETKRILRTIELIYSLNGLELHKGKQEKEKFDFALLISDEINDKLEKLLSDYGTSISLYLNCKTCKISTNKSIVMKILTEVFTNVIKYSNGSDIKVELNKKNVRHPILSISSDGVPFSRNFLNNIYLPCDKESKYYSIYLPHFAGGDDRVEIRINVSEQPMIRTMY
jgi:PAS domain S-box-containing protein